MLNVEAGRGIAAALVVAYHADKYYFGDSDYWANAAFRHFFSFGNAGVEFFFVLSGFIIAFIHWGDLGKAGKVKPFLQKRFTRLFPFYWLCLAAALAVFVAVPSFGEDSSRELGNIVSSVFLVGGDPHSAVIFVSWTLYHEVLFYALAGVAIWRPRVGVPAIGVWLLVSAANGVLDHDAPYVFQSVNILFAIGVACALIIKRRAVPAPVVFLVVGAALFLLTGVDQAYIDEAGGFLRIVSYGTATALMLLGATELERSRGWQAPRVVVLVGQASYSVYLTHMLTLAFAAKIAAHLGIPAWLPGWAGFIVLAAAAVIVGVAVHFWVEKPAIRATRARLMHRGPGRIARCLCAHNWHAWTWEGAKPDNLGGTVMVCGRPGCGVPAHPLER